MLRLLILLAVSGLLALPLAAPLRAADNAADAKLRETLRNTIIQLRTAEADRDNLQTAQTQNDADKKALTEQVATLIKQINADKDAKDIAEQNIAKLNAKAADQEAEIARLKQDVEKWKTAQKQAADTAAAKEAERAKFAGDVINLQRTLADREAKNVELFKVGNEILTRYERFGLGDAISAREPFVGVTRVKLENLVQDYRDKLLAQKIRK
jgi:chromosome segregation ATPase